MKRVAFVFTHGPHGGAGGREGLDALLATSALSEDLGVFFVGDGVLQLLPGQQPEKFWRAITSPPSACCRCMTWNGAICARLRCRSAGWAR